MKYSKALTTLVLFISIQSVGQTQSLDKLYNSLPDLQAQTISDFYIGQKQACAVFKDSSNEILFSRRTTDLPVHFENYYVPLMGYEALGDYAFLMNNMTGFLWNFNHEFLKNIKNDQLNFISQNIHNMTIVQKSLTKNVFEYVQLHMDQSGKKSTSLTVFDFPKMTIKKPNPYTLINKVELSKNSHVYIVCENPDIQDTNLKPLIAKSCGLSGDLLARSNDCNSLVIHPNTNQVQLKLISKTQPHTELWQLSDQKTLLYMADQWTTVDQLIKNNKDNCHETVIAKFGTDFGKKWTISSFSDIGQITLVDRLDPEMIVLNNDNAVDLKYNWLSHTTSLYAPRNFYCTGR